MSFVKLGAVFVIIMVAVSAAFNFTFGWRLGEQSHTVTALFHDGWIYGFLSIASDGFKICLGVLTVSILLSRNLHVFLRVAGASLCGILFVAATLYSLNSAVGTISQNRTDMAGLRQAQATNYDMIEKQLERVQDEQSWLDQKYRAAVAVEADMASMRQSHLWTRTSGCADATVPESRTFCQQYYGFSAELGTAQRAEQLARRADELRASLVSTGGKIIADPHAKMLNDLTGYGEATIVLAWLLLVVALVEGGSTLGPIVIWLARRAEQPQEAAKPSGLSVAVHAPRRPAGLPEIVQRAQPKLEAPVVLPPEPEMPPDGDGTPVEEPQEPVVEEVKEPKPTTVVSFPVQAPPKALSRRELAREKKERIQKENRQTVERFVTDRLDTGHPNAQLELTPSGNRKAGGTEGPAVYRDYHRYCKARGVAAVGSSLFGKFVGEFVESARNHKCTFYGVVIKAEAKRRVA